MNFNPKVRTLILLVSILLTMTTIVVFSVPIYNLFCKVTGYGGTTSYSSEASLRVIDRDIKIRFNADVNDSLNWSFLAPQNIEIIKVGENIKVEYIATNNSLKQNVFVLKNSPLDLKKLQKCQWYFILIQQFQKILL